MTITLPEVPSGTIRFIALGGLGEVGRNMAVLESQEKLLIIDAGVLFPEDHQPGVDLVLPDYSMLRGRWQDVVGIVLTHAHEDHIGALPFILKEAEDLTLVGSQLTLALVREKLREYRISPDVIEVTEGQKLVRGPFELEYVAVNHSIPDALAVAIKSNGVRLLHTGDFKMDQLPLDGRLTDLHAFGRIGQSGVDLFMVDSTNAEVPGFTTSEREIAPVIDEIFERTTRRIVVACFSSHVHRVQQIFDAAVKHDRQVALIGRSMVRNMKVASELGFLRIPDGVLVDPKQIDDIPDQHLVLICTGSQGEPMAALSRMATGDHQIQVGKGDSVVLASSLIPGNENPVFRVINGLLRRGAEVIHKGNALVHVSGHAAAGELEYCYRIVKPKAVLPVHGEWRHLKANSEIARKSGIAEVVTIENGEVIDVSKSGVAIVGSIPVGFIYVDGESVGDITETSLKDRRILGEEGFISIVVAIDVTTGKVLSGPDIHARGFVETEGIFDEVTRDVEKVLAKAALDGVRDNHQLSQLIRRTVGQWVSRTQKRRPMILPLVVEI